MRLLLISLLVMSCPLAFAGQSPTQKAPSPTRPSAPANQDIQTETVSAPTHPPPSSATQVISPGRLDPTQVKALTHKIWLAQYRLNDLLSQLHPEKWKMSPATRQSFDESMDSLRKAISGADQWRSQFETRPDSLYLGFQTYVAIGALLPRIDGVAHSVSQYENASFGAQYSQAANQLFDLQQMIQPHLASLLKNQDNLYLATQTNLASCQNELNFSEHDKEGRAVPMRNIAPAFKGRKASAAKTTPKSGATSGVAASTTNPPTKSPQK